MSRVVNTLVAWLLLALASYLLGAGISGIAATIGFTNYPHDTRGEWGPIVGPLLCAVAIGIGWWPFRFLRRAMPGWVVSTSVAVMSLGFAILISRSFGVAA